MRLAQTLNVDLSVTARSDLRVRRIAVGVCATLAAWLPSDLAAAAEGGAAEFFVAGNGTDQDNDCRAQARACRTIQRAVDAAAGPGYDGRNVTIYVGSGTFLPRDGGVHVAHGSPASLAIVGAGEGVTTLRTPLPNSGEVVALTIAAGFGAPVRVSRLRITGHGFDADPGSGGTGSYVTGIKATHAAPLRVASLRIDNLSGGQGAAAKGAVGGDGGSVYGIDRRGGPTELDGVEIARLRGGPGGPGSRRAGTARPGGAGGSAIGVNTDGALTVASSRIGRLRGGHGAAGANGGDAYSAAVQTFSPPADASFVDSELSDNLGGRGGIGVPGGRGAAGGDGGQGGDAIGISHVGHLLAVEGSTLSGHRGAPGGRGGTGGRGEGSTAAGHGGRGGVGGAAAGAVSTSTNTIAATAFGNSTFSANRAGVGGSGGPGGARPDGPRGAGGDGGDGGGVGAGLVALASPGAALTTTVTHVSVVANLGAAGGLPGAGDSPGVRGGPTPTAGGVVSNAPTAIAASLFDNDNSPDCLLPGALLLDGGWNVSADGTCVRGGAGSQAVPKVGTGLRPLAENGGPTRTLAIRPDSPAARAVAALGGLCGGRFATDQRGSPRPGSAGPHHCAAGAYEPSN